MGGLGRVLIAVYMILAIAATFRSVYQILSKFDEAPLAYERLHAGKINGRAVILPNG